MPLFVFFSGGDLDALGAPELMNLGGSADSCDKSAHRQSWKTLKSLQRGQFGVMLRYEVWRFWEFGATGL